MTSKMKGTHMTDKRLMRTLSGEKLEALIGSSPLSALAEAEIARRQRRRARKAKALPKAA